MMATTIINSMRVKPFGRLDPRRCTEVVKTIQKSRFINSPSIGICRAIADMQISLSKTARTGRVVVYNLSFFQNFEASD